MRFYWDGALSLGRVHVADDSEDLDVFMSAESEWWRPREDKWGAASNRVQVEVLGPSEYLERIPDADVAQVQAKIRARLGI